MRAAPRVGPSRRLTHPGRAWPCALLLVLALAPAARGSGPRVLLVSLDGTPPEVVRAAGLETLARLAREGASGRLVPVFPTNTFPNHVTFVTGVAPERHGIVNNVFRDRKRGSYRYDDDPSWIDVEPLWSLLAQRGIPSAAFHWVGSEGAWRNGLGPRHWRPFDASVAEDAKVEQILAWLDLADAEARPRLVTSWFRGADRAAHRHGPGSKQVARALRAQDRALGRLAQGIAERGLWPSTTLLIVSDHGMAPVAHHVDLARALDQEGLAARVYGGGGFAIVEVGGEATSVERALAVARSHGLEAYRPRDAPRSLRLSNPRFGDLVVLAPLGTAIARPPHGRGPLRAVASALAAPRGAHGYRPEQPEMQALLVAFGRGVEPGVRLGEVSALAIAPTVLALLDVPAPSWMEGRAIPEIRKRLEPAAAPVPPREGMEAADAEP